MVSVASVDLREYPDLYKAIIDPDNAVFRDDLKKDNVIIDEKTQTVWIQWYNEGVA